MTEHGFPHYSTGLINPDQFTNPFRTLRAASINVCGGVSNHFFTYLCDTGLQHGLDIIGVQETKISANKERYLLPRDSACQYQGYWEQTATHYHGKGVGLLVNKT